MQTIEVLTWAEHGPGKFAPVRKTVSTLTSGVYHFFQSMEGAFLVSSGSTKTDNLIDPPGSITNSLTKHFLEFQGKREAYRKYGIVHKRGILMYGPPGTGKTCTLRIMEHIAIEQFDAIVLRESDAPQRLRWMIERVRSVEPTRPILAVIEDIDENFLDNEREALTLLDGEVNVDGVVFLATTNNLGHIKPRVRQRPSRFDIVIQVGAPNNEMRSAYIQSLDSEFAASIEGHDLHTATAGMTLAQVKEVFLLVQVYGKELEEAVESVKSLGLIKNKGKKTNNVLEAALAEE